MDGDAAKRPAFGRLVRVDLRTGWLNEATDFTPWLARPENLSLLAETLGLTLELQTREASVGPFRADIVCRVPEDDRLVLIENQLERTDHDHLGKLVTYASSLEAAIVVWIAGRFTEEHRGALDWLNRMTRESLHFFGVEVELWRIGNSPVAPRFNIVAQSNDHVRRTADSVRSDILSERGQVWRAYWQGFAEYLNAQGVADLKVKPGTAASHLSQPIDAPDCYIVTFYYQNGPGVYLRAPKDPRLVGHILKHRDEIEAALGVSLERTAARQEIEGVSRYLKCDPTDQADWPRQFGWLVETYRRFRKVLEPVLQEAIAAARAEERIAEESEAAAS